MCVLRFLKWQSFSFCKNDSTSTTYRMTTGEETLVMLIVFVPRSIQATYLYDALSVNGINYSAHEHFPLKRSRTMATHSQMKIHIHTEIDFLRAPFVHSPCVT